MNRNILKALCFSPKGIDIRKESKINVPIQFADNKSIQYYFGDPKQFYKQFDNAHHSILNGIAELDDEYLQEVMEKKLFNKYLMSKSMLEQQNLKFKYIEVSSEYEPDQYQDRLSYYFQNRLVKYKDSNFNMITDCYFGYHNNMNRILIDISSVFGVKIDRSQNETPLYSFRSGMNKRQFHFYRDLTTLFQRRIIVSDVYYVTGRKLVIVDQDDNMIEGFNDNEWTLNMFRFETYDDLDNWILTDIDDVLDQNPYYSI